jgi:hypothetical protein
VTGLNAAVQRLCLLNKGVPTASSCIGAGDTSQAEGTSEFGRTLVAMRSPCMSALAVNYNQQLALRRSPTLQRQSAVMFRRAFLTKGHRLLKLVGFVLAALAATCMLPTKVTSVVACALLCAAGLVSRSACSRRALCVLRGCASRGA